MSRAAPATTLPELLARRAAVSPTADACFSRRGECWIGLDWNEMQLEVARSAGGLQRLGLRKGDRIAIWARTRLEWLIAEMAAHSTGAVVVGIDAHAAPQSAEFILRHSEADFLIVDQFSQLGCLSSPARARLRIVVQLDPPASGDSGSDNVIAWASVGTAGACGSPSTPEPDDPATLIYTSGTTGQPKGIEYSHRQLLAACGSIRDAYPQLGGGDRAICWLPMAPLFQRMMNYVALAGGVTTWFVSNPREIIERVGEVRPSVFVGVPRFYEKLHEGMQRRLHESTGLKRWLIAGALASAAERGAQLRSGRPVPPHRRAFHRVLDRLVLRRLREVLGGRIKFMITGSAPAPVWLLEFFHGLGLPLLEAYGTSENTVPIAGNRLDAYRLGSVGKPFPRNEVRIAADGEVQVRGPGLFRGYLDEGAPSDRFTSEGFYCTGDLGRFDADGFLYLTGRKAELIKTSTGRRISPARVEAAYSRSRLIDQMVVVGNGRPDLVALITLNISVTRVEHDRRAVSSEPVADRKLRELVQAEVDRLGDGLAAYERVQRFAILPAPLSVETGELTPSLKLRRAFIEQKYSSLIESLYAARESSTREHAPASS